jgi:hypothetical protein
LIQILIIHFILRERWHAISNPFEYRQSRLNKNKKYVLVLFLYCFIISVPFFWVPTLTESIDFLDKEIRVEVTCDKPIESEKILPILDSLFYCFIPFLITLLFSVLTVKKIIQVKKSNNKRKNRRNNFQLATLPDNSTGTRETRLESQIKDKKQLLEFKTSPSLFCMEPEFMVARYLSRRRSLPISIDKSFFYSEDLSYHKKSCNLQKKQKFSSSKRLYNFKITFLLLVFPFCFLVTNFPITLIIAFKMFNSFLKLERNLLVEFTIAKSLLYLNNSINILLLICFSRRFRKNFFKTFFKRSI